VLADHGYIRRDPALTSCHTVTAGASLARLQMRTQNYLRLVGAALRYWSFSDLEWCADEHPSPISA